MAKKQFDSQVSQLVQQFAHVVNWADGDAGRLGRLSQAMTAVIEGKVVVTTATSVVNWNPPSWWRDYDQQMARQRQLWGDIQLPEPPANFVPRPGTKEVPLLHVPQSVTKLWNSVKAPAGYTALRWPDLKTDKRHLRLAPNVPNRTEPVWLAFDPEHGKGQRPDSLWGQPNLAASEVFSALIQFPDWPLTWFKGASAPNLAGYQYKYGTDWSGVLCVRRWDVSRRLKLSVHGAVSAGVGWASPAVREVQN